MQTQGSKHRSIISTLKKIEEKYIWLILPVVMCLSQRLSHACLSVSTCTVKLRMAHCTTKTISNFLPNIGHLKQSSLTQKCHGKSKGDTIPTIPFLEDVICA